MFTIDYEEYYNDYNKSFHKKTFSTLRELENWIFDSMHRPTNESGSMWFPTSKDGIGAISFRPDFGGANFWIKKITSGMGIEFSDGTMTNRQKHMSDKILEFCIACNTRAKKTTFNFVD